MPEDVESNALQPWVSKFIGCSICVMRDIPQMGAEVRVATTLKGVKIEERTFGGNKELRN